MNDYGNDAVDRLARRQLRTRDWKFRSQRSGASILEKPTCQFVPESTSSLNQPLLLQYATPNRFQHARRSKHRRVLVMLPLQREREQTAVEQTERNLSDIVTIKDPGGARGKCPTVGRGVKDDVTISYDRSTALWR